MGGKFFIQNFNNHHWNGTAAIWLFNSRDFGSFFGKSKFNIDTRSIHLDLQCTWCYFGWYFECTPTVRGESFCNLHFMVFHWYLTQSFGFQIHSPPTAASILFELYQTKANDYYIQLFYKNSTDADLEPLNIPTCGHKCSLGKFRKIYKSVIPVNSFEEECQLPKSGSDRMKSAIMNEKTGSPGFFRSKIIVSNLCWLNFLYSARWATRTTLIGNCVQSNSGYED